MMDLLHKIPKEFYKLFASKYLDYDLQFLVRLYQESSRSYSLLGLTEEECKAIINEQLAVLTLDWTEEQLDEEGEQLTKSNMAAVRLKHYEDWGWLVRDFDESLNCYVVSFPEYSQLYVELFAQLQNEDDSQERESLLAVYSGLYTYNQDQEKDPELLKSALHTSQKLLQMLSNMQEGMRGYFDELSQQKSFRGVQEVLVKEINNSDSQEYAILTTTDSFYRYKEAVKELLDQNSQANEERRNDLMENQQGQGLRQCEETAHLLQQISRTFDAIERRYNKLIEQKTVFASRAAARLQYISQEGAGEEDRTVALINRISKSDRQAEILQAVSERMQLTEPYRSLTEDSFFHPKAQEGKSFKPQAVSTRQPEPQELSSFVLQPLYTQQEVQAFYEAHEKEGVFCVTEGEIESVEDLEKLFLIWQGVTEHTDLSLQIETGKECRTRDGYTFSELRIRKA